jgi:hypothetical protein
MGLTPLTLQCPSILSAGGGRLTQPRAKREFVPEHKKDHQYWNKRHKNNESARQSRLKRKKAERDMEVKMVELQEENIRLKWELKALKKRFNVDEKVRAINNKKLRLILA